MTEQIFSIYTRMGTRSATRAELERWSGYATPVVDDLINRAMGNAWIQASCSTAGETIFTLTENGIAARQGTDFVEC